jgi:hypothetical protein
MVSNPECHDLFLSPAAAQTALANLRLLSMILAALPLLCGGGSGGRSDGEKDHYRRRRRVAAAAILVIIFFFFHHAPQPQGFGRRQTKPSAPLPACLPACRVMLLPLSLTIYTTKVCDWLPARSERERERERERE